MYDAVCSILNLTNGNVTSSSSSCDDLLFSASGNDGETRATPNSRPNTAGVSGTAMPAAGMPGGMSGMFNSPGMQSLMQQMMENPQLMQNMMNAPYTQSMFQNISSNPQLAEQIIVNNPLFAGNFHYLQYN